MVASPKLSHIPTNIITGFLGVGKTTAIEYLLRHKPTNEKWAILVNEFGEVGIDASLVSGNYSEQSGVYLREVPGGCMCCASGLPMQIALNMLLVTAKPDRLLIEPTGLGHPREVLAVLSGQYYRDVLDLRATITLIDARKLSDSRYIEHPTFIQQLEIADVLVANKADLYQAEDHDTLLALHNNHPLLSQVPLHTVEHGKLHCSWLQGECAHRQTESAIEEQPVANAFITTSFAPQLPECGYLRIDNHGQGFNSSGWLFDADFIFDQGALYSLLAGVEAVRLKGVFITTGGVIGYNKVDNVLTQVSLDDAMDSRIELISTDTQILHELENALLECIINRGESVTPK